MNTHHSQLAVPVQPQGIRRDLDKWITGLVLQFGRYNVVDSQYPPNSSERFKAVAIAAQCRRGGGVGIAALAELLAVDGPTAAAPVGPHFAPKAKSVIFTFIEGGPSQHELFDPKPGLEC